MLLAAAAVTVVLASAGVTVVLLNNGGDKQTGARPTAPATGVGVTSSASGRGGAVRTDDPKPTGQEAERTPKATGTPDRTTESTPTGRATTPSPTKTSGGGDGGTSGGDGGATGGGDATPPTPACSSIGGGKYNCTVWKTADSYTASGTKAGVLKAGINYFYCQQNLGRRETDGEWTNVWWARTDDDSGNTDVYVSDVYIKGGDNDEPVPGLPVC